MSWLSRLQSQPVHKKMVILWSTVAICSALLLGAWIVIGNYHQSAQKDTSLFQSIGASIKNASKQNVAGEARKETVEQQQRINQQLQQKK